MRAHEVSCRFTRSRSGRGEERLILIRWGIISGVVCPLAKGSRARRRSRFTFLIPVSATIIIVGLFLFASFPPHTVAAQDFQFAVSILVEKSSTTTGVYVQLTQPIGEPGGLWNTSQFNSYGLDGHYPIYAEPRQNTPKGFVVHVRSSQVLNYTFGDFFAVWGESLGNVTLGVQPGGGYSWSMCLGTSSSNLRPVINSTDWPKQDLKPDLIYFLKFGTSGCV